MMMLMSGCVALSGESPLKNTYIRIRSNSCGLSPDHIIYTYTHTHTTNTTEGQHSLLSGVYMIMSACINIYASSYIHHPSVITKMSLLHNKFQSVPPAHATKRLSCTSLLISSSIILITAYIYEVQYEYGLPCTLVCKAHSSSTSHVYELSPGMNYIIIIKL